MPGLAWRNQAYRRKFMLRSLATPFSTLHLLNVLAQQPQLIQMLHVQPGLPCRLHRPWLSVNMSRAQAVDALHCHYQRLADVLPVRVFNRYLTPDGVTLAVLSGKDDQTFTVRLRADAMQDKEGEATLQFYDAQEIMLAELTFTFCRFGGKNTLYIGGLQGAKAHVPHERIQTATRACHGLFPKRLLVEVAMTLGQHLGAAQIRAVSNETHIYRSLRYRRKKQGHLHADYNSFWASLGARVDERGDYVLPNEMRRKPMEEIASKKRAEYRRRYALSDSLHQQTRLVCQR
ncbi:VirK family virulence factor [Trabulsiella guamensis ATCC 49490]|uniref:VirK family virulence factor n=2 Tax=Trabulsiella guamensis TaxID=158852 RepID=A0A085AG17_9ENTR|nr:VirK family virulence factor [Trabulsiella guamensis ATCC 49490]